MSIIEEEMKALNFEESSKVIPRGEKTRLIVLNVIFSVLLFLFIGLIFYHVSITTYLIGLAILFLLFRYKMKIDVKKYIYK